MVGRIRTEGESARIAAFKIDEVLLVFAAQPIEQIRMNNHFDLVDGVLMLTHDRVQSSLQLDAHCHRTFDNSAAIAVRTRDELRASQALCRSLTRHLHEPE